MEPEDLSCNLALRIRLCELKMNFSKITPVFSKIGVDFLAECVYYQSCG